MHLRIIIAAAAVFLLSATALAQPQACHPLEVMLGMAHQTAPVRSHVKLDPVQTSAVVAWFNRQPPESEEAFNLVVLVQHENGRIGIMLGNDGEVCFATILSPAIIPALMQAITGEAA